MQDIKPLGITFVSENFSNSIDSFWIIIKPEFLINPFDFISVENVQNTKTIGIVKELKSRLACGGTAKDGFILLQGDHRDIVKNYLVVKGFNESSIEVM